MGQDNTQKNLSRHLYRTRQYGNKVGDARKLQCGVVRLSEKKRGTEIGTAGGYGRTFAYVKTTEPLDAYRVSDCRWIYRP